jgi:hypothetical protein
MEFLRGLICRFGKEITPHFVCEVKNKFERDWSVLGVFDYAKFQRIDKLSDIEEFDRAFLPDRNLVDSTVEENASDSIEFYPTNSAEIALFRHSSSEQKNWEQSEETLIKGQTGEQNPSFFMVWFNLSSAAIDGRLFIDQIEGSIIKCSERIKTFCDEEGFEKYCIYETLGGPDLVLVVELGQLSKDLELACNVVYKSRSLTASDLAVTEDSRVHKCHAFASSYSFLVYSHPLIFEQTGEKENRTKTDTPKKRKRPGNLEFISAIRSAPGHELEILKELSKRKSGIHLDSKIVISGDLSIITRSSNLAGYFSVIQNLLPDSLATGASHRNNVHLSRTTITTKKTRSLSPPLEHDNLTLASELNKVLSKIGSISQSMPISQLRRSTRNELQKSLTLLQGAFIKNENANAARDLIPFLLQFQRCLMSDEWDTLFKQVPTSRTEFENHFSGLLIDFNNALRNRIEHRFETLESSFSSSLDFAANRLINAYSIISWIAWERFIPKITTTNEQPADRAGNIGEHCFADRFGIMVTAGFSGKIKSKEYFGFARQFRERRAGEKNSRFSYSESILDISGAGEWNSPLLTLSISGANLFRPEIALIHFLQEMSRVAQWPKLKQAEPIRKAVNEWVLDIFSARVVSSSDELSRLINNDPNKYADVRSRVRKYLVVCTCLRDAWYQNFNSKGGSIYSPNVSAFNYANDEFKLRLQNLRKRPGFDYKNESEILVTNHNPTDFPSKIYETIADLNGEQLKNVLNGPLQYQGEQTESDRNIDEQVRRALSNFRDTDEFSDTFRIWKDLLNSFLDEYFSYYGMWECFKRILQLDYSADVIKQKATDLLNKIFSSIIDEYEVPDLDLGNFFAYFRAYSCLIFTELLGSVRDWKQESSKFFTDQIIARSPQGADHDELKCSVTAKFDECLKPLFHDFFVIPYAANSSNLVPDFEPLLNRLAPHQKHKIKDLFNMPESDKPEYKLLKEFNKVWGRSMNDVEQSQDIECLRFMFIRKLWCKSQRFAFPQAYTSNPKSTLIPDASEV